MCVSESPKEKIHSYTSADKFCVLEIIVNCCILFDSILYIGILYVHMYFSTSKLNNLFIIVLLTIIRKLRYL